MQNGWFKLYRDLLEKPLWVQSTPEQKTVLITLLSMANHQEKEWEWKGTSYKVAPGQFVTSLESIAEKCGKGISIQNVRTALKRFEKYEFLTNESTNKNRLVTIVNWGFYQGNSDDLTNQLTGNQQAVNKQLTTNKNEKKDKNEKNNNTSCPKQAYDENSSFYKLSFLFFEKIKMNNPAFKEPNFQKWSNDIRLMIERDNRTPEQIKYLINWCQNDNFWKSNILSPAKLRKQFDQLIIRVKSESENKKSGLTLIKTPISNPDLSSDEIRKMKKLAESVPL
ncbi:hypothetical protein ACQKGD_27630 [Peribacillus frigoritolerans]|uniref:hypothetical protein n=1 Tax=Peribacillus frigoritolerans TaxID=450367 RepID=UPI003CFC85AC